MHLWFIPFFTLIPIVIIKISITKQTDNILQTENKVSIHTSIIQNETKQLLFFYFVFI